MLKSLKPHHSALVSLLIAPRSYRFLFAGFFPSENRLRIKNDMTVVLLTSLPALIGVILILFSKGVVSSKSLFFDILQP